MPSSGVILPRKRIWSESKDFGVYVTDVVKRDFRMACIRDFVPISIFDGNHSTSRDTRCSSFKFPVLRPIVRETPTRGIDSHSNAFRSCEITSDVLRIFGFFHGRKVVMEIFVFDIKRYCTILRINYVKKSSTINARTIEITTL